MGRRIPEALINKVREETDIIDVIGHYVDLSKRGKNYFGFCPFHDENTPSFSVEAEHQFFKCFSCGRGGSVFNFIMELEHVSFPEAVEKVADLGGLQLDFNFGESGGADNSQSPEEREALKITSTVKSFYHYILTTTQAGQPVLQYLNKRAITDESIAHFHLGYAPKEDGPTQQFLLGKGFSKAALVNSGVMKEGQAGLRDAYRGRLIFPIFNASGACVGFSGRLYDDQADPHAPKYLNTEETLVFKKNRLLYHLNEAKASARRAGELVLFEGYMDVIQAWQVGVKNGVASLGTSLTSEQIRLLRRHTQQILLAYDGDEAGIEASRKALEHFAVEAPKIKVYILIFPKGQDPDEYIRQQGAAAFRSYLYEKRLTPIQFYRFYYQQKYSLADDEDLVHYVKAMLQQIARLEDHIEIEVQLQELAHDTGLGEEVLKEQYEQLARLENTAEEKTGQTLPMAPPPATNKQSALYVNELQLLHRLLFCEEAWVKLKSFAPDFHFQSQTAESLFLLLGAVREQESEDFRPEVFLDRLMGERERQFYTDALALTMPSQVSDREIQDLIFNIQTTSSLKEKLAALNAEIKQAKASDDYNRIAALNRQRIEILRQRQNYLKRG